MYAIVDIHMCAFAYKHSYAIADIHMNAIAAIVHVYAIAVFESL